MITCNLFMRKPRVCNEDFWPFQYIENELMTDEESDDYTADFFTQRALEFVQSTTVRETFGLSLKDVLGMDYGMFLYLERLVKKMDKIRKDQLDQLEDNTNNIKEENK